MFQDDDEPSAPFWMTTFSDLVTLLLAFFVMIVAMSEVEVKKFKEALSYFQGRTGMLQGEMVLSTVGTQQRQSQHEVSAEQAERYEELLKYLEETDLDGKVEVQLTEEGLHISITDSVMFASGRTQLVEPARTILRRVAGVLRDDVGSVVIEGHTDNRPIRNVRFPSNWELSAARATSVVRFLGEERFGLPPERYVAIGYGEHHPRDTNTTPAGRARNRRVDILFSWEPWQIKSTPQPTSSNLLQNLEPTEPTE